MLMEVAPSGLSVWEGIMNSVRVLICGEDAQTNEELRQAIKSHCSGQCEVIARSGELDIDDLAGHEENHPPDVVVWRVGAGANVGHERLWDLVPGTRFVVIGSAVAPSPAGEPGSPQSPFAALTGEASLETTVKAVDAAVSSCWWRQLCELDMPACQISRGGRILRMNPCMRQHFAGVAEDSPYSPFFFDLVPPASGGHGVHPIIDRVLQSKKAQADFAETTFGQMQFVCLPDLLRGREVRTVSVLMPDTGRRARVLTFAKEREEKRSLREIYSFIIGCGTQLGYKRVRLYRCDLAVQSFRGVASEGFDDPVRRTYFETEFDMPIADDAPSREILETRLASLCIHDPKGEYLHKACSLVRVYPGQEHRNYEEQLELQGCNRWVEAPLVVPGTNEVIGKLVVDNATQSDTLTVRDALDVGFLAMMSAGAIYAFQAADERRALVHYSELLNDIYAILPRIVLEKEDRRFYRVIAALLSCHAGLQWEQVLLFIADGTGLRQAECEMALGGVDANVRAGIQQKYTTLAEYVDLALSEKGG